MLKIRKNVFETNSSSTHSIVISKKDRGYSFDFPVDEEGKLIIPFGKFGWTSAILRDPIDKLSYYITDNGPGYQDEEDEGPWEKRLEEFKESELYKEVIDLIHSNCPYVKEIEFEPADREFYPFGYVDHGSCGTSKSQGLSLYTLVFNNSVIILIDNDNGPAFDAYFPWDGFPGSDIEELFDSEYIKEHYAYERW